MENSLKLKIDATSGASGDMFLASLLDLLTKMQKTDNNHIDSLVLIEQLKKLAKRINHTLSFEVESAQRAGQNGLRIELREDAHVHKHDNNHSHAHIHVSYSKLVHMITKFEEEGVIDAEVAKIAKEIYHFIAIAESKAHNEKIDKVHFHELGEDDSIFDVLGNAFLINELKKNIGNFSVESSAIEAGSGNIMTSHGDLTIPAPATLNLITDAELKITNERDGEYLTPTGAGIFAYLKPTFVDSDEKEQKKVLGCGVGCGSRNPIDKPNILKLELELN